jgi:hypothetical protein
MNMLKVKESVMALNVNIHENVRIPMPQTLLNTFEKALITEEEVISKGQGRTPARLTGLMTPGRKTNSTSRSRSTGPRTRCWMCGETDYQ